MEGKIMNKKILTIVTMMLLAFSLTGCIPSKEEMIASAIEMDWQEIHDDKNVARAEEKYGKGFVKWTGSVSEIGNNYIIMYGERILGHPILPEIDVYLSKKDLCKLNIYETVTVVGKFEMDVDWRIKIKDAILVDNK